MRLSHEHRLDMQLRLRVALIHSVRSELYHPQATCPACGKFLTTVEIVSGFLNDPADFTTCCPHCKVRFNATLICYFLGGEIQLPFYCAMQTLEQLPEKKQLSPEEFLRNFPALYRSAIFHFGSLRAAFQKKGVNYLFHETPLGWQTKVSGFLGRVPDTLIAAVAGVPVRHVRQARRDWGIKPFHGYED